jgi:hypothetical protein
MAVEYCLCPFSLNRYSFDPSPSIEDHPPQATNVQLMLVSKCCLWVQAYEGDRGCIRKRNNNMESEMVS